MVYVINNDGSPLMPTNNAKARVLLKNKKAKVKTVKPFTIQLLYDTSNYTQPITLGIDSGYLNIGFSAITNEKELIKGEVSLLENMSSRIQDKAMYRKSRRCRLRYRKARWNNRKIKKGWLAPSIQHKLDTHIRFINKIYNILPISKTIIEVANFDIQKIKNPDISGAEYQQGEQMGFWNLREYILHRDGHKCQNPNCKNKDKNPILEVHHIIYRSNGGTNKPNNLVTLCTKCHTNANHKKGKFLYEWQEKGFKTKGFKDATYMNIIRWQLINKLKEKYENIEHTYGYITKNNRIKYNIDKSHCNDAFCIAGGNDKIIRNNEIYYIKQVRRNNRRLERFYDAKYIDIRTGQKVSASELNCGRRTRNKNKNEENLKKYRGEKISKGRNSIRRQRYSYQPHDLVYYKNEIYTVIGAQSYGKSIGIKRQVDGKEIKKYPSPKFLTPYRYGKGLVFK